MAANRINVREHGVVADGVTDDTEAWQAVNDLAFQQHAYLYCDPPGTILVTRLLRIDRHQIPFWDSTITFTPDDSP